MVRYFVSTSDAQTAVEATEFVNRLFTGVDNEIVFIDAIPVRSWFRQIGWEVQLVVIF